MSFEELLKFFDNNPILNNKVYEVQNSLRKDCKWKAYADSKSIYENTNGITYLTVGTAGDELQQIKQKEDYYVIQKEKYGFLNLKLENKGQTIVGEFHTNNDKILDNFQMNKT